VGFNFSLGVFAASFLFLVGVFDVAFFRPPHSFGVIFFFFGLRVFLSLFYVFLMTSGVCCL